MLVNGIGILKRRPADPPPAWSAANVGGYGRTSTLEQTAGLDAQLRDLKAAGVGRCEAGPAKASRNFLSGKEFFKVRMRLDFWMGVGI